MEMPHIGANCQWAECKTLDFLPITCVYCNATFCHLHFQAASHQCKSVVSKTVEGDVSSKNPTCSMDVCATTDVVEMLCVKCNLHFCLAHRYHSCFVLKSDEEIAEARKILNQPREKFSESLGKVSAQIEENIEKSKKTGKNRATAMKVQLMRLKGKAVGEKNIPGDDRIYFSIYLPLQLRAKSKAVYVSKGWTVGRTIDSASSLCDVPNKNNVAREKKLRLFRKSDGTEVSSDLSEKLGNLLEKEEITNGESLILEYVQPDEPHNGGTLQNLKFYVDS